MAVINDVYSPNQMFIIILGHIDKFKSCPCVLHGNRLMFGHNVLDSVLTTGRWTPAACYYGHMPTS